MPNVAGRFGDGVVACGDIIEKGKEGALAVR